MTFAHVLAGVAVAAAIGVGAIGFVVHLCWLAATDRGELVQVLGMLLEVAWPSTQGDTV